MFVLKFIRAQQCDLCLVDRTRRLRGLLFVLLAASVRGWVDSKGRDLRASRLDNVDDCARSEGKNSRHKPIYSQILTKVDYCCVTCSEFISTRRSFMILVLKLFEI